MNKTDCEPTKNNKSADENLGPALARNAVDFICAGVSCNAMVAVDKSGLLDQLVETQTGISLSDLALNSITTGAVYTLLASGVLVNQDDRLVLTPLGRSLATYRGMINVCFDGYSNLLAGQAQIAQGLGWTLQPDKHSCMAIQKASDQLAEHFFMAAITQTISTVDKPGQLCDLGCGSGKMLTQLCQALNLPGLGIELSQESVENASRRPLPPDLTITYQQGDLTQLSGIWPEVDIMMQTHVFHDFMLRPDIQPIMTNLQANFPNHRYFVYVDTVAPSSDYNGLFPGFDYIHGLLDIPLPTYDQTLQVVADAGYTAVRESPIAGLPNTFLWMLERR